LPRKLTPAELKASLDHKYFMAVDKGHDVSLEEAVSDFFTHYEEEWRKQREQDYIAQQKRGVEEHKWYESEKAGHEVKRNTAAIDFINHGFAEFRED